MRNGVDDADVSRHWPATLRLSRSIIDPDSLMEQAGDLGERSRKFEALPLFIATSLDLTTLSKLFPDEP